ncbi:MAG TPA: STAS domain-containing protein [Gammaproteobacteria bacterium]|nr:STAS domain-containing protein [Gammaproteobacteria bacterium]
MESKRQIIVSDADNTVTIQVVGSMDFSHYRQLHKLARKNRKKQGLRYVFDWSRTSHLHSSGIATLLNFSDWVTSQQGLIEFTNCGSNILQRLSQTGTLDRFAPALPMAQHPPG